MNETIEAIRRKWTHQKNYLQEQRRQFKRLRDRLDREELTEDDKWELRVLFSTILADTYSGFERIFKEVAERIDDFEDSRNAWHKELLNLMTSETSGREPVISSNKEQIVEELLKFRHMSRKKYPGALNWEELMDVISDYEEYFEIVYDEIDAFVENIRENIDFDNEGEKNNQPHDESGGLDMDL